MGLSGPCCLRDVFCSISLDVECLPRPGIPVDSPEPTNTAPVAAHCEHIHLQRCIIDVLKKARKETTPDLWCEGLQNTLFRPPDDTMPEKGLDCCLAKPLLCTCSLAKLVAEDGISEEFSKVAQWIHDTSNILACGGCHVTVIGVGMADRCCLRERRCVLFCSVVVRVELKRNLKHTRKSRGKQVPLLRARTHQILHTKPTSASGPKR